MEMRSDDLSSFDLNALPDLPEGEEVSGGKHAEPAPALQPPAGAPGRLQGEALPSGPKQCAICLKVFPSMASLHGHMRCHPANLRRWGPALVDDGQNQDTRRRFICDRCGQMFATRQSLGGHRASHKGQQGCYGLAKEARECGSRRRINERKNRAFSSDEEAAAAARKDANNMLSILFAGQERSPSSAPRLLPASPIAAGSSTEARLGRRMQRKKRKNSNMSLDLNLIPLNINLPPEPSSSEQMEENGNDGNVSSGWEASDGREE